MRGLGKFMLSEGARYRDLQLASDALSVRKAAGSSESGLDGWSYLMRTADGALGFLYFENNALRSRTTGWRPNALYVFTWFDPPAGEWRESIELRTDGAGTMQLPPFAGRQDVAATDWAATIRAR